MTTDVDIANRALIAIGSQNRISNLAQDSTEAALCNAFIDVLRDELNRMAPWNCATKRANLVYITSTPGTPENPNPGSAIWNPGLPAPPWAYEYQYPIDCLRARSIVPQYTTTAGGVPIYPAGTVTGTTSVGWAGPALKYEIATDQFYGVTGASSVVHGTGYAVGDIITLSQPNFTFTSQGVTYVMPVGTPAQVQVNALGGGGSIASVAVINQIQGSATPIGGSYFSKENATATQQSTTGVGTGATFSLTYGNKGMQRIILCNQEMPIIEYNAQITDPNIMDPLFQEAWVSILAARVAMALHNDRGIANQKIAEANNYIMEARKIDGNEGITVNDVTPDFLRIRGDWGGPYWEYSPNMSFDWGSFYSPY